MKGRDNSCWNVKASTFAKKTFNPIRNIVENLKIEPHPDKQMIALSIGDPTVFGNLAPAPDVVEAVVESVRSGKNNGYIPSTGTVAAREAIAEYMSCPTAPVDAKDVIICSGCSYALDLCLSAMCDAGSNILVPKPGFPLYTTLSTAFGVTSKFYHTLPDKNWQIDLEHLESLIDSNTAAILMNNPSNPCGSVYPKQHLMDLADIAIKYKIPIIADEIYDHFVFEGHEYHPIASVNPELPVLACGGLTKRFLVPGWRTGWIAIHDRGGALTDVAAGLKSLSQRIIGSNTIVQGAIPTILKHTPQSFFDDTINQVQSNAQRCYSAVEKIPGLRPTRAQGAMYMMVGIEIDDFPEISTDLQFVEMMVAEQSVFCLPGKCFNIPNFFRIVLTVPADKMTEACDRMKVFCETHHILTRKITQSNQGEDQHSVEIKRLKLDAATNQDDSSSSTLDDEANTEIQVNGSSEVKHAEINGGKGHPITNGNYKKDESTYHKNDDISSHGLGSEECKTLHKEVAEMQSAMLKECAIRGVVDELVDEMERD